MRLLVLRRDEVVTLSDRLSHEEPHLPPDVHLLQLLLRIGSVYLELTDPKNINRNDVEVGVMISEPEAVAAAEQNQYWRQDLIGRGLRGPLLRKLYRLLLDFNNDVDLPSSESDGEAMTEDRRRALERYRGDKQ